jgi:peptidoglycan/LPS O-acetylase OafA/YrhL
MPAVTAATIEPRAAEQAAARTRPRYVASLDGIRGLGILFVLLFHYAAISESPLADHPTMTTAWIWVQMFFVQSGYLITAILLGTTDLPLKDYLKRFYWRRAVRIFPIYFAYLGLFLLVFLLFHRPRGFGKEAPFLFSYTYNFIRLGHPGHLETEFVHFWSLSVEEQFYLVWPLLVFFLRGRRLKALLIAIVLLTPLFRFWFAHWLTLHGFTRYEAGQNTYMFTLSQFDGFAFGAAIPVFRLNERIRRPRLWAGVTVAGALAIAAVNFYALGDRASHLMDNAQHVWAFTLVDFTFMMVILHLTAPGYRGLFNAVPLVRLGKVVYGLYVFHFAILLGVYRVASRFNGPLALWFLVGLTASWVAAHLSYQWFEKRFLALKGA